MENLNEAVKLDTKRVTPQGALERLKDYKTRRGAASPRAEGTASPRTPISALKMGAKSPRNPNTPRGAEDRLKQIELQKRRTSLLRSNTPRGQKDLWAKLSSSSSEEMNFVTNVK
jgi:hypothetical protein